MGFLAPRDLSANPAPVEVYNWRVYALAISAAMGSSMFGYDSAFIGGTMSLPAFQARFGLEDADADLAALRANIVSTFQAGCFFGVLGCYPTVERLGMKWTLVLCGLIFNVGAIIQTASSGQVGMIYAGRALTGKFGCIGVNWRQLTDASQVSVSAHLLSSSPSTSLNHRLQLFVDDSSAFSKSYYNSPRSLAFGSTTASIRTSPAAVTHSGASPSASNSFPAPCS